jgi:hypothetical protein
LRVNRFTFWKSTFSNLIYDLLSFWHKLIILIRRYLIFMEELRADFQWIVVHNRAVLSLNPFTEFQAQISPKLHNYWRLQNSIQQKIYLHCRCVIVWFLLLFGIIAENIFSSNLRTKKTQNNLSFKTLFSKHKTKTIVKIVAQNSLFCWSIQHQTFVLSLGQESNWRLIFAQSSSIF